MPYEQIAPLNPVGQVFRRISRQRDASATVLNAGHFDQTLAHLCAQRVDAVIECHFSNALLGRLLLQSGVVVYASLGDQVGPEALSALLNQADHGQHRLFPLEPLALALACAAVDGVAVAVPRFGLAGLADHLSRARLMGFNGLVAAERGIGLLIWQFQPGRVQEGPTDIPDISSDRVMQWAWVTRLLPAVGDIAGGVAQLGGLPVIPPSVRPPPVAVSSRPQAAAVTPDAWSAFSKVMAAHLGARAGRVVGLMRQDHGALQGEALNAQLLKQIERVGGAVAAREFRQRMNP